MSSGQVEALEHVGGDAARAQVLVPHRCSREVVLPLDDNGRVTLCDRHAIPHSAHLGTFALPRWLISLCWWKGIARYYTLEVEGIRNTNAAWSYPWPWPWIRKIRGHVAFWKGVEVARA